jgi:hypothetical protein
VITGKPAGTGKYRLTLRARNSLGSAKQTLILTVRRV